MIVVGADHRGFKLKQGLKRWLKSKGYEVEDIGAETLEPADDYPDYAQELGIKIKETKDKPSVGILICGSGHGMDMAANKLAGIRAALCWDEKTAQQSRNDENANVLVLPSDWLDLEKAEKIVKFFLETEFSNEERHKRRLNKIEHIDS